MSTTPTATILRRDGENVILSIPEGFLVRESAQTASNDSMVRPAAGEYTYRPITIGGTPTTFEKAYFFTTGGSGVLHSGGYKDQTPGETIVRWGLMPYGYSVRSAVEALVSA